MQVREASHRNHNKLLFWRWLTFADENMRMTDCYYEKKDWRKCKDEVRRLRVASGRKGFFFFVFLFLFFFFFFFLLLLLLTGNQMEAFTKCWKAHGNDRRTSTQDAA